jgi:hypothetical protein
MEKIAALEVDMYKIKHPKNEALCAEFKEFYHGVNDNKQSEAVNLDYSVDTIYAWADTNKLNDMPVWAVARSNHGDAIIEWLMARRKGQISANNFSDDWGTLIELLAILRSDYLKKKPVDYMLASNIRNLMDNLIDEYHSKK